MLNLLLSGMSQSSSNSGAPKPNYNKHFPRSFLLNYGRALENLPDDKIFSRFKDWNCKWLLRQNSQSEFASMLKDNLPMIQAYKGMVFAASFMEQLEDVITPLITPMKRLDNKDRSSNEPPNQEDLFVDAFNAAGPLLMMAIHTMAVNTLLHNPPDFANQALRCAAIEQFKENPSDENMMGYLLDSILMRRRSVQRTWSLWDRSHYQPQDPDDLPQRPSQPAQRLDTSNEDYRGRRRPVSATATNTARSASTSTTSGRRTSTPNTSTDIPNWSTSGTTKTAISTRSHLPLVPQDLAHPVKLHSDAPAMCPVEDNSVEPSHGKHGPPTYKTGRTSPRTWTPLTTWTIPLLVHESAQKPSLYKATKMPNLNNLPAQRKGNKGHQVRSRKQKLLLHRRRHRKRPARRRKSRRRPTRRSPGFVTWWRARRDSMPASMLQQIKYQLVVVVHVYFSANVL